MQNKSFLEKLPLLLWAIGFVPPFFFLMWGWALFLVVAVSVLIPLVSVVFYAPLKSYAISRGVRAVGFISGITEGIVTAIIIGILGLDVVSFDLTVFVTLLIFAYCTNQIARILRENTAGNRKEQAEEVFGLYGFLATLPLIALVWWFWV